MVNWSTALIALLLAASWSQAEEPLPSVFTKPVPESVTDLQEFQTHLLKVLPKMQAATVALRIGDAHGSGVFVNEKGLIMTAGHVSGRPGKRADITLSDGRHFTGRTLGRNRHLDSGLIQIDGDRTDWPFCPLVPRPASGNASSLGDWCVSIGHPGGLQEDRPAPVRLGRVIVVSKRLLQTDCELVGGDSGGPLFNMRGEIIGINSRIGQPLEFNYHVPTAIYQQEWDKLLSSEDMKGTSGALLGISGKADTGGLRITRVYDEEPAARAGVKVDDLLVTFDGKPIKDMDQLIAIVGDRVPGEEVVLELLREGKKISLKVELDMRWD